MKLMLSYLSQRRKGVLAVFLFCLLFMASFLLYHLPMAAVLYPAGLCLLLGAVFFLFDFHNM